MMGVFGIVISGMDLVILQTSCHSPQRKFQLHFITILRGKDRTIKYGWNSQSSLLTLSEAFRENNLPAILNLKASDNRFWTNLNTPLTPRYDPFDWTFRFPGSSNNPEHQTFPGVGWFPSFCRKCKTDPASHVSQQCRCFPDPTGHHNPDQNHRRQPSIAPHLPPTLKRSGIDTPRHAARNETHKLRFRFQSPRIPP